MDRFLKSLKILINNDGFWFKLSPLESALTKLEYK